MTLERCEQTIHACRNGLVGVRDILAKLPGFNADRWSQLKRQWELKEKYLLRMLEEINSICCEMAEAEIIDTGYDDDGVDIDMGRR